MNTNLATKNQDDYTITPQGAAYISQTAVGRLCGVSQHAISQHILKTHDDLNLNEINQIGDDSLELVIGHYAFDSQRTNKMALMNYRLLAKAGAKAYIYHEAGYQMAAAKAPLSRLELAKLQVVLIEQLEESRADVLRLEVEIDESLDWASIKKVEAATKDRYDWRNLKDSSATLGIDRKDIFDANYGTVKSYHKDLWMDAYGIDISTL